MKPIISVRNLSKKYIIGESIHGRGARTFRDIFDYKTKRLFRRNVKKSKEDTTIWALKDVSFDVNQGEVVGIIGRNGAGKSTLLKILSRITEPTAGNVTLRGRVASLLEVGTGFNQELTGRENIFLNGSILGMKKSEIKDKFDEIVSFAEIEKFIDTPVKRYSSGMYVRLAFAVAAHLEPEILLVDEVLAVGDAGFQKKCLGKLDQVASEGRTVLLVSHNMAVLQGLCSRSFLLSFGQLILSGLTQHVVSEYIRQMTSNSGSSVALTEDHPNRLPRMQSVIHKVTIQNEKGDYIDDFEQKEPIILIVYYDTARIGQTLAGAGFILESAGGVRVGGFNTYMGMEPPHKLPSRGVVRFVIREPSLTPGRYMLTVSVGSHQNYLVDKIERVLTFNVRALDIYGTGYLLAPEDGVVAMKCDVFVE